MLLLPIFNPSLGRREKLPQKVGRKKKLAGKVGRREIYPPVPSLLGDGRFQNFHLPYVRTG